MPDAFDPLAAFDPGPGPAELAGPLPAAEVRRLGDRRRRRSTALVGLGAAAAIAAVMTPITLLASNGSDGSQGQVAQVPSVTASRTASVATRPTPSVSPTVVVLPELPPSATPEGAEVPSDIPADFPLAAGLPDDADAEPGADFGLIGPARAVPITVIDLCRGALRVDPPGVADRLAVSWSNPEDVRDRLLITFGTADEAVAYVDRLVQQVQACRREPGVGGFALVRDVLPTEVGGQSVALVFRSEVDGSPSIGRSIYHVIRFGKAVLVDRTYNEGGGEADPVAAAREQVDAQTTASAEVVAAMCRFARAGCPS